MEGTGWRSPAAAEEAKGGRGNDRGKRGGGGDDHDRNLQCAKVQGRVLRPLGGTVAHPVRGHAAAADALTVDGRCVLHPEPAVIGAPVAVGASYRGLAAMCSLCFPGPGGTWGGERRMAVETHAARQRTGNAQISTECALDAVVPAMHVSEAPACVQPGRGTYGCV